MVGPDGEGTGGEPPFGTHISAMAAEMQVGRPSEYARAYKKKARCEPGLRIDSAKKI